VHKRCAAVWALCLRHRSARSLYRTGPQARNPRPDRAAGRDYPLGHIAEGEVGSGSNASGPGRGVVIISTGETWRGGFALRRRPSRVIASTDQCCDIPCLIGRRSQSAPPSRSAGSLRIPKSAAPSGRTALVRAASRPVQRIVVPDPSRLHSQCRPLETAIVLSAMPIHEAQHSSPSI